MEITEIVRTIHHEYYNMITYNENIGILVKHRPFSDILDVLLKTIIILENKTQKENRTVCNNEHQDVSVTDIKIIFELIKDINDKIIEMERTSNDIKENKKRSSSLYRKIMNAFNY